MVCTYNQCSIYQDCVKRLDEDMTRDECEYHKKNIVGPFELRVPPRPFMDSTPCSKLPKFSMDKISFVLSKDDIFTADIEALMKVERPTLLSRGPQADLFIVDYPWKPHVDMMIKTKHLMEVAAERMGSDISIGYNALTDEERDRIRGCKISFEGLCNKDLQTACNDKPFDYEEFDRVTRDLKNRFANRELMSKATNEDLIGIIVAVIVEYKERADHSEDKAHLIKYLKARVNNAIDIKE